MEGVWVLQGTHQQSPLKPSLRAHVLRAMRSTSKAWEKGSSNDPWGKERLLAAGGIGEAG